MHRALDFSVSLFLLIAAIFLFALTFTDQFDVPTFGGDVGPAFAPRGFLVAWTVLAVFATLSAFRSEAEEKGERVRVGQLAAVIAIAAGTALAMTQIGFVFATIPGFFLFCWAFGYRKWVFLAVISILGPLGTWATFNFVFELPLPNSPWFNLF